MNTNDSCETRNSGSAPPAPSETSPGAQPSRPTQEYGAPSLGAPDRNPRLIAPGIWRAFEPAWDDQPAAWRDAFGSAR
jgi:hypothetical protein